MPSKAMFRKILTANSQYFLLQLHIDEVTYFILVLNSGVANGATFRSIKSWCAQLTTKRIALCCVLSTAFTSFKTPSAQLDTGGIFIPSQKVFHWFCAHGGCSGTKYDAIAAVMVDNGLGWKLLGVNSNWIHQCQMNRWDWDIGCERGGGWSI